MDREQLRKISLELPPLAEDGKWWTLKRRELREHLANGDVNEFLRWPEIGVTMFVGNWPFIQTEFEALAATPDHDRWFKAIEEVTLGQPELWPGINSSANLIHQAYHLLRWEQVTGKKVSDLVSVVEIGGGYGAMARLLSRLGFAGRHQIFDFPELALLQSFYLSQVGVKSKVEWITDIPLKADLLLATWSLSEIPLAQRDTLLQHFTANNYLFAFQEWFEGVHNPTWFSNYSKDLNHVRWQGEAITHHPGENWYLWGIG